MRTPRWVIRTLARGKPLVPDRAWPALLAARSWVGSGPVVGLPALSSVLVLAPHPDDETIGAGGTLRLLADRGARVTVAFATSGEATRGASEAAGEVAARRRAEAEAACGHLGVTPEFLGHPDGRLSARTDALAADLGRMVGLLGPQAVFLPWFADGHPDHEACSAALARAGLPPGLEVWAYETWTPLPANRIVDVTDALAAKKAALAAHTTAHQAFDIGATLGLSRYRSVHGLMGRGYAEAFLAGPLTRYLDLAAQIGTHQAIRGTGIPLATFLPTRARRPPGAE